MDVLLVVGTMGTRKVQMTAIADPIDQELAMLLSWPRAMGPGQMGTGSGAAGTNYVYYGLDSVLCVGRWWRRLGL